MKYFPQKKYINTILKINWIIIFLVLYSFIIPSNNHNNNLPIVYETNQWHRNEFRHSKQQFASYTPIYIGTQKDSINASGYYEINHYFTNQYPRIDSVNSNTIKFAIDTTRTITKVLLVDKNNHLVPDTCSAYPVFTINITPDTLYLSNTQYISIYLEALNPKGNWQRIEQQLFSACPSGDEIIVLPPGELILTSVPVYKGGFQTKMRLNYGGVYTAEFIGGVELGVFE